MAEWPKTAEDLVNQREVQEGDRADWPLIPADLGRELYEALKVRTTRENELRAAHGLQPIQSQVLTRYEREVGNTEKGR